MCILVGYVLLGHGDEGFQPQSHTWEKNATKSMSEKNIIPLVLKVPQILKLQVRFQF